jgi:hypothetical protein
MESNTSITKTCTKCRIEKALDNFYLNKKNKSGRENQCKSCHSETCKAWKARNREKCRAYRQKWNKSNPEKRREILAESYQKRKDGLKQYYQRRRDQLCDFYVKNLIALSTGAPRSAIPSVLVETLKVQIAISRLIKGKK